MYRDIDLGFGGYVYAQPGMYGNVAILDVKSMHPHSAIAMNLFGKYTERFANLVETGSRRLPWTSTTDTC